MAKVLLEIATFALLSALMADVVYAINLGSAVKNNFAEIPISESAKFTLLFWNTESETYVLKLSAVDYPEGWTIIIDPEEFLLNKSTGEEYISLPYSDENVKAKVVNVFVKPDEKSNDGRYYVVVEADARETGDAQGAITVVPIRSFRFEVELSGSTAADTNEENAAPPSEDSSQALIENETPAPSNENVFYFVLIILIVAFSVVLYKKS
jgi:uncharacterized membrane protein